MGAGLPARDLSQSARSELEKTALGANQRIDPLPGPAFPPPSRRPLLGARARCFVGEFGCPRPAYLLHASRGPEGRALGVTGRK